jgi:hypothetical protein
MANLKESFMGVSCISNTLLRGYAPSAFGAIADAERVSDFYVRIPDIRCKARGV